MNSVKEWLYGIVAAVGAVLLAVIGVQRRTIDKQRADADKLARREAEARSSELTRREAARAKANEESQARRDAARKNMSEKRRNQFEQD